MPAFSGLWNGVYAENYAKTASPTPPVTGMLRVLMQKRGLYGMVRGFGRKAPTEVASVQAQRGTINARGGWKWPEREDDAANRVAITNIGGDVNALETIDMPNTATEQDMVRTADTVINREYTADIASSGVTAPALPEARAE